jgi:hypothetical protein
MADSKPPSVLEMTALRIKAPYTPTSPALLKSLQHVRAQLGTDSKFFHILEDPSQIYILGLWPSLAAHQEFLASPKSKEILGPQEDKLEFIWGSHVPLDSYDQLPLKTNLVAFTRLWIAPKDVEGYQEIVDQNQPVVASVTAPHPVYTTWRIDAPEDKPESFLFTGWENLAVHEAFMAQRTAESENYKYVVDNYPIGNNRDVKHGRDMEGHAFRELFGLKEGWENE